MDPAWSPEFVKQIAGKRKDSRIAWHASPAPGTWRLCRLRSRHATFPSILAKPCARSVAAPEYFDGTPAPRIPEPGAPSARPCEKAERCAVRRRRIFPAIDRRRGGRAIEGRRRPAFFRKDPSARPFPSNRSRCAEWPRLHLTGFLPLGPDIGGPPVIQAPIARAVDLFGRG